MLKPVVEHQTIDRKSFQDPVAKLITIGPDGHDRFGTPLRHQEGLIACLLRAGQYTLAIRYQQILGRTGPPIAPAENCHPFPLSKEPIGQHDCLLYTSDAADERSSVDLGGRRIIKKKKT